MRFAFGLAVCVSACVYVYVRLFEDLDNPIAGVTLVTLACWQLYESYKLRSDGG